MISILPFQSQKFKRVSDFRGLSICVDFELRDLKNGEYEENN